VNEFLEDLTIEGAQCFQQAESYSQVLSNLMDAWASIISNNLNIRIKMLTILSICIMVPTLVVSIFSMNVQMPFQHQGTLIPFWTICGLAAASSLGVVLLCFYRKWYPLSANTVVKNKF